MVTNYTKFLLTIRIIYLIIKLLVGLAFGLFWVVIKFIALLPKIVGDNGLKKMTKSTFDIVDRAKHQSDKIDNLEQDFNLKKSKELTKVHDAQAAKEIEEAIDYISLSVSSSTSKPLSFLSNFIDITSSQIGFYMDLFNPNSHAYSDIDSYKAGIHDNSNIDLLKAKGDRYESAVGLGYEVRGDLVIYNGFIKGMKDEGVDIVAISSKQKSIHLVQCKNWDNRHWKNRGNEYEEKKYTANLESQSSLAASNAEFRMGDYVEHKLFGKGKILSVEGSGDTAKLTILFSGNVRKKLIVKYAKLIQLQA